VVFWIKDSLQAAVYLLQRVLSQGNPPQTTKYHQMIQDDETQIRLNIAMVLLLLLFLLLFFFFFFFLLLLLLLLLLMLLVFYLYCFDKN